jgi:DNA-binding CsgD family transcriptional regulator
MVDGTGQDRFLVSAAVLSLLAQAAESTPVVCLLDDIQWLDSESVAAMAFAARRLHADPVAVLLTVRDGAAATEERVQRLAGATELPVGPLDAEAVDALMNDPERPELDHRVRQRVVDAARGNPLALVELSRENALRVADIGPGSLSLSARLEESYLSRVRGLPQRTQHLLLVAAASESGLVGDLLRAARDLGLDEADLGEAERAQLLLVSDGGWEFAHPLVRSAVYGRATSAERRRVHAVLASSADSFHSEAAVWHRANAAAEPDDDIAEALQQLGESAVRRGAAAAAAQAFQRAATLASDPEFRSSLLVEAAAAAWQSGHTAPASQLVEQARGGSAEASVEARLDHLRGLLELRAGRLAEGYRILLDGAAAFAEVARDTAAAMLADASLAASYDADLANVVAAGALAERLWADTTPPPAAAFVSGIACLFRGEGAKAAGLLKTAIESTRTKADAHHLTLCAAAYTYLGDYRNALPFARQASALARERGALRSLVGALEVLSVVELATAPAMAEAHAAEGAELALETDQTPSAAVQLSTLVTARAYRGDEPGAQGYADRVFALATAQGHTFGVGRAQAALGFLDLSLGRPVQAMDRLEHVLETTSHPAVALTVATDLVEAAVRAGSPDRGHVAFGVFVRWAERSGAPLARALASRSAALLDLDDPESRYQEALTLLRPEGDGFELARTELLFGEYLRRERRRVEARSHLRSAWDSFARLGAQPWAERARVELRATGESARPRHESSLTELTPQELQIARLVADGAATKDVAAQLFLSPRTVDYHLRKVFTKTGISSRAELRRLGLGA